MQKSLHDNINSSKIVNQFQDEVDRIAQDPEAMLALVDLIFGFQEDRLPPS